MARIIFLLTFVITSFGFAQKGFSQLIKIGLHTQKTYTGVYLKADKGAYSLNNGEEELMEFLEGEAAEFKWTESGIEFYYDKEFFGKLKTFYFTGKEYDNYFKLRLRNPQSEVFTYDDNVILKHTPNGILIINELDLDDYLAGVMEAEIGKLSNVEFLKTLAIITRTYTLQNVGRFSEDGYDLCDHTTCQMYLGKNRFNDSIRVAVDSTNQMVIVDKENKLIEAVYHSNSGGHTANAEDVWKSSKKYPYLRGVKDPYGADMDHACWQMQIRRQDWIKFLEEKGNPNPKDICLTVNDGSNKFLSCNDFKIPLLEVRNYFGLNSTIFDSYASDGMYVMLGKGFGHRVGLSQEGAYHMGTLGFSYVDIINHYYQGVKIISMEKL